MREAVGCRRSAACLSCRSPPRDSEVHHPAGGSSSARCEQVEGSLAFILSGAHLGYLPEHIAQPWVERGGLRALPGKWDFTVQFRLASHRGHPASEAQKAFADDLLDAFGE
jgi:DNA-binding transcriptional LysR family regulator